MGKKDEVIRIECPGCGHNIIIRGPENCLYCGYLIGKDQIQKIGNIILASELLKDGKHAPEDILISAKAKKAAQERKAWIKFILSLVLFILFLGALVTTGFIFKEQILGFFAKFGQEKTTGPEEKKPGPEEKEKTDFQRVSRKFGLGKTAELSMKKIGDALTQYASKHEGFPRKVTPALKKLEPYGNIKLYLQQFDGGRILGYKVYLIKDGSGEIVKLQANTRENPPRLIEHEVKFKYPRAKKKKK